MYLAWYNTHKQTLVNFSWRLIQSIGKQGFTLFIFYISSIYLSQMEFGKYNYFLAIIYFFILISDFGISFTVSKLVAELEPLEVVKKNQVLFNGISISLIMSFIVALVSIIIVHIFFIEFIYFAIYGIFLLLVISIFSVLDGFHRGSKHFLFLAKSLILVFLLSLVPSLFLIKFYNIHGSFISLILYYLLACLLLSRKLKYYKTALDYSKIKEILRYSIIFGFMSIGYFLFSRVDILILGHFKYIQEIAVYEIINKIFLIAIFPVSIASQVVIPHFAKYLYEKRYNIIYSKLRVYFLLFMSGSMIFGVISYFILPLIFKIFFANYSISIFNNIFTIILLTYSLIFYSSVINLIILLDRTFLKFSMYLNIIIGLVNLLLSVILLNYIGYFGAILATLISTLMGIIVLHTRYFLNIRELANSEENK